MIRKRLARRLLVSTDIEEKFRQSAERKKAIGPKKQLPLVRRNIRLPAVYFLVSWQQRGKITELTMSSRDVKCNKFKMYR